MKRIEEELNLKEFKMKENKGDDFFFDSIDSKITSNSYKMLRYLLGKFFGKSVGSGFRDRLFVQNTENGFKWFRVIFQLLFFKLIFLLKLSLKNL